MNQLFCFFSKYPADIVGPVFTHEFIIDIDKSNIQEMDFEQMTDAIANS
jgi:hypothetical protein